LVGCVRGIAAACTALDFPVVSGNVSLYNETKFPGETTGRAILPTPTIGGVGLIDDFTCSATLAFKRKGEAILLLGATQGWLGQSLYLRDICGREAGAPPPVDLAVERRNGEFVRALIRDRLASAVHDVSDGGLLVALAEMAMMSNIGAELTMAPGVAEHAYWFGEDQGRYIVTVEEAKVQAVSAKANQAGVPIYRLGVTGGDALTLPGTRPMLLATLSARFEGWLPGYMAGGVA
jgi:phosphoribosylformylglycinamidine synthase